MEERVSWILKRRSIRRYKAKPVEEEKINLLMKAAMAAPSAANRQPWHFIVVTQREILDQLAEVHPYAKMLKEAPLCVVVCGDPEEATSKNSGLSYWVQDCSAAMQNLLLAASSLDLGGVWLGVHPNEEREKGIKDLLKIPEKIRPLGLAAIGYPEKEKKPNTHYREERVHGEVFEG